MATWKPTGPKVFISSDGDNIGSHVAAAILSGNIQQAHKLSLLINLGGKSCQKYATTTWGAKTIIMGGDDLMCEAPAGRFQPDTVDLMRAKYKSVTGATLSAGIGSSPEEAMKAIVIAKNTGKNKAVFWTDDLEKTYQQVIKKRLNDLKTKLVAAGGGQKISESHKMWHIGKLSDDYGPPDFHIERRGSAETVGSVSDEPGKHRIPVYIMDHRIHGQYAKYAVMHAHAGGFFKAHASGTTRLVNIRNKDIHDALKKVILKQESIDPEVRKHVRKEFSKHMRRLRKQNRELAKPKPAPARAPTMVDKEVQKQREREKKAKERKAKARAKHGPEMIKLIRDYIVHRTMEQSTLNRKSAMLSALGHHKEAGAFRQQAKLAHQKMMKDHKVLHTAATVRDPDFLHPKARRAVQKIRDSMAGRMRAIRKGHRQSQVLVTVLKNRLMQRKQKRLKAKMPGIAKP